jgi:hypothetical protein
MAEQKARVPQPRRPSRTSWSLSLSRVRRRAAAVDVVAGFPGKVLARVLPLRFVRHPYEQGTGSACVIIGRLPFL